MDDLGIVIDVEKGTLIETLRSWGNGEDVVPVFAASDVLYGYNGTAMFVIDFKDAKALHGSEKPAP